MQLSATPRFVILGCGFKPHQDCNDLGSVTTQQNTPIPMDATPRFVVRGGGFKPQHHDCNDLRRVTIHRHHLPSES
ncbi:MAG: hypothetical protein ACKOB3_02690, partial [Holophagaceae bacterium]